MRSPPTSRTAVSASGPSVDDRPRAVVAGEEQRVDEAVVALVVGGKDRRDGADAVAAEVAVALVITGGERRDGVDEVVEPLTEEGHVGASSPAVLGWKTGAWGGNKGLHVEEEAVVGKEGNVPGIPGIGSGSSEGSED